MRPKRESYRGRGTVRSIDTHRSFIKEKLSYEEGKSILNSDLRTEYRKWLHRTRGESPNKEPHNDDLHFLYEEIEEMGDAIRQKKPYYHFTGVGLK